MTRPARWHRAHGRRVRSRRGRPTHRRADEWRRRCTEAEQVAEELAGELASARGMAQDAARDAAQATADRDGTAYGSVLDQDLVAEPTLAADGSDPGIVPLLLASFSLVGLLVVALAAFNGRLLPVFAVFTLVVGGRCSSGSLLVGVAACRLFPEPVARCKGRQARQSPAGRVFLRRMVRVMRSQRPRPTRDGQGCRWRPRSRVAATSSPAGRGCRSAAGPRRSPGGGMIRPWRWTT